MLTGGRTWSRVRWTRRELRKGAGVTGRDEEPSHVVDGYEGRIGAVPGDRGTVDPGRNLTYVKKDPSGFGYSQLGTSDRPTRSETFEL